MIKNLTKKRLLFAGGIALLVVAVLTSFGFWLYSSPATDFKVKTLTSLNLPVAKVGRGYIGAREMFARYETAKQLYGGDKAFQPAQAQNDILNRLVEVKKLEKIAAAHKIEVTAQELEGEYNRLADQDGGPEKFENMLTDQYHFTKDEFKQKALLPDLLKSKLAVWFYSDKTLNPGLYETLAAIQSKLTAGNDFGDLAKIYSEDPTTKSFGGDSGEIPFADLAPEFQTALKDAQPGETKTVTTRLGVYLVRILNRKDDSTAGTIHFQTIYLNYGKVDPAVTQSAFTKWFDQQTAGISTEKFINL